MKRDVATIYYSVFGFFIAEANLGTERGMLQT
jgi:hypothetical protein